MDFAVPDELQEIRAAVLIPFIKQVADLACMPTVLRQQLLASVRV